ncbi:MAG: hypothetical protein LH473_08290 [Chitinophagales bacterium]|nr:hypothetical protein [Chitinophagales bacterium]
MQKKKKNISTTKSRQSFVVCLPEDEKDRSHLMTEENRAHEIEKLISAEVKKHPVKSSLQSARKRTHAI